MGIILLFFFQAEDQSCSSRRGRGNKELQQTLQRSVCVLIWVEVLTHQGVLWWLFISSAAVRRCQLNIYRWVHLNPTAANSWLCLSFIFLRSDLVKIRERETSLCIGQENGDGSCEGKSRELEKRRSPGVQRNLSQAECRRRKMNNTVTGEPE